MEGATIIPRSPRTMRNEKNFPDRPKKSKKNHICAAEAIFCCPTENSRHLEA
jgi:hypothetical protein